MFLQFSKNAISSESDSSSDDEKSPKEEDSNSQDALPVTKDQDDKMEIDSGIYLKVHYIIHILTVFQITLAYSLDLLHQSYLQTKNDCPVFFRMDGQL